MQVFHASKITDFISKFLKYWVNGLCLGFVTWQIIKCTTKYNEKPQGTDVRQKKHTQLPFPAITVCGDFGKDSQPLQNPLNRFSNGFNNTYLNYICGFDSEQYVNDGKWATKKDNCSDPKKLFESITFKQEDVIQTTRYEYWNGEDDVNNKHWHPIDSMNMGHCLSLNVTGNYVAIGITLLVNSTIFFHTPGMFEKVTQEKQDQYRSFIKLGNLYEFNLKYEYWDFRKKLHDYDGIPCNDEKGYSKDLCYHREIEQELLETFGCTTPFVLNKSKICTNATIARDVFETYREAMVSDIYKSCLNPCTFFSILPLTPTRAPYNPDKAYVEFYLDENELFKIYESYYIYSEVNLIAEIGGYVGLFLGISVNQVTNLMDLILAQLERLCQRLKY